ncbi:TIGR04282 family arsenosugar biosynthesis glycosyltransferase [Nocardia sp. IBHARD005]|uniref:TIGR04282 family arsenosugar biosynthesis glycosyltransferase n=1 Tax=Nocardia sp. IBHARD005 TaxID=3457765 RepID=UPI0040588F4B
MSGGGGPTTLAVTLLVIAKAPIAGYAKTRLTPPLTPRDAADIAAASLLDTLDSVSRSRVAHRVIAFTGELAAAQRRTELTRALSEFEVIPQRGTGFGTRLANAHADAARHGLPVLQIGMDTPQVGPEVLTRSARALLDGGAGPDGRARADAVLGLAEDGGWWALGLTEPQAARVLVDVPMSTPHTGALTREALQDCGNRVRLLPAFADVDTFDDALHVAAVTGGHFADAMAALRWSGLARR